VCSMPAIWADVSRSDWMAEETSVGRRVSMSAKYCWRTSGWGWSTASGRVDTMKGMPSRLVAANRRPLRTQPRGRMFTPMTNANEFLYAISQHYQYTADPLSCNPQRS